MFPVSEAYKAAVVTVDRKWKTKVHIQTALESLEVTGADVVEKGLKVIERVISGTNFSVGGVAAADLYLSLKNDGRFDDVQLNGAIVKPEVGLKIAPDEYEWVPLGIFVVDTVESKIKNPARPFGAVDLLAGDNMLRFDRPFSKVNIPFPCTAKNLLIAVCQYCGVPLATSSFLHDDYVITARPEDDLTCRDIVRYIAELACSWARCNRWGQLELEWFKNPEFVQEANIDGNTDSADGGDFSWWNNKTYDGGVFKETEPDAVLDTMNRYDLSIDDDPVYITGVILENDNGILLAGSDRYAIRIVDNPLIQDDAEAVIQAIYERIKGFTYIPFSSNRRDDPAMQAGDMVELANVNGKSYRTVLTEYNYVYGGRSLMAAAGVSEVAAGYQYTVDKKVSRLRHKIAEKQEQINAMDLAARALFTLFTGVAGGYRIDGDKLGGIHKGRMYLALDNPDIEVAQKVWAYSMAGIFYFENGIYNPPSTAWGNDGSALFSLVTAEMIRTGLLQSLNGKTWLNLDDGTFNLGDGSLVYDGETFEAVSAEKITSADAEVYAKIGDISGGGFLSQGLQLIDIATGNTVFSIFAENFGGAHVYFSPTNNTDDSFLRKFGNTVSLGAPNQVQLSLNSVLGVPYFIVGGSVYGLGGTSGYSRSISVPGGGTRYLNFIGGICVSETSSPVFPTS